MNIKRLKHLFIITIILFISIGFAVLSTNLSINGLFNFTPNTWSIKLKNVVVDDKSVTKNVPTINQDEDTITFSAELDKPGDYYSFNIDVLNESTIDAMLGSITVSGITSQYSDYLSCVVTYSNGTIPNPNDILYKTARVTLNVKLLYKDITTSQIPENVLNPTITITVNYRQANNDAVFVSDTNHWNFDYTGSSQAYIVPINGTYKIEAWGASGGGSRSNKTLKNNRTGLGGYTKGNISLSKDKSLYIFVGGKGADAIVGSNVSGGYNGGGLGTYDYADDEASGGGGGATDIRLISGNWDDFNSLKSRIMVAAGGAGKTWDYIDVPNNYTFGKAKADGYGGGLSGFSDYNSSPGTQTSGYKFGQGEDSPIPLLRNNEDQSGAGSGYYGGTISRTHAAEMKRGGAGGSSFISGHNGCDAISEESTEDDIVHTGQSIHYSGNKFINTVMIDGGGHNWTNVVSDDIIGQPDKDGLGTVIGNMGNGYVKITIISL